MEQILWRDINIYREMEELMDIIQDILLQISWVLLHRCHIWWKLNQIKPVLLRKARVLVTKENYRILQFLDFLKDIDQYADENDKILSDRIRKYVVDVQIKKTEIDCYIKQYPDRIYRYIYEMRLYDVFA